MVLFFWVIGVVLLGVFIGGLMKVVEGVVISIL